MRLGHGRSITRRRPEFGRGDDCRNRCLYERESMVERKLGQSDVAVRLKPDPRTRGGSDAPLRNSPV